MLVVFVLFLFGYLDFYSAAEKEECNRRYEKHRRDQKRKSSYLQVRGQHKKAQCNAHDIDFFYAHNITLLLSIVIHKSK